MNLGKNIRKTFLFFMLGDMLVFGVIAVLIYPNLKEDAEALPALLILLGSLAFVGVILFLFLRPMIREQAIIEKGEQARARLIRYWDTGTTINDNPMVGMQLEVLPAGGKPYHAETKSVLSRLSIGMLRPGAPAVVVYDPNNPEKVAFVSFVQEDPDQAIRSGSQLGGDEQRQARLAELDDLRRRGMLSELNYERRRKELLDDSSS